MRTGVEQSPSLSVVVGSQPAGRGEQEQCVAMDAVGVDGDVRQLMSALSLAGARRPVRSALLVSHLVRPACSVFATYAKARARHAWHSPSSHTATLVSGLGIHLSSPSAAVYAALAMYASSPALPSCFCSFHSYLTAVAVVGTLCCGSGTSTVYRPLSFLLAIAICNVHVLEKQSLTTRFQFLLSLLSYYITYREIKWEVH